MRKPSITREAGWPRQQCRRHHQLDPAVDSALMIRTEGASGGRPKAADTNTFASVTTRINQRRDAPRALPSVLPGRARHGLILIEVAVRLEAGQEPSQVVDADRAI